MRHSGSACPPKLSPPRSRFGEAGSAKAEPGMFQIKCRSGHFEEYSMSTPKSVRGKTTATTSKLAFLKELPGKLRLPKLTNIFFPADCYLGTVKGGARSKAVSFSPSADPFMATMRFSLKMPHPGLTLLALRKVDERPEEKPDTVQGEKAPAAVETTPPETPRATEQPLTGFNGVVMSSLWRDRAYSGPVLHEYKPPAQEKEWPHASAPDVHGDTMRLLDNRLPGDVLLGQFEALGALRGGGFRQVVEGMLESGSAAIQPDLMLQDMMDRSIRDAEGALRRGDFTAFDSAIAYYRECAEGAAIAVSQAEDQTRAGMSFAARRFIIEDLIRNRLYIEELHSAQTGRDVQDVLVAIGRWIKESSPHLVLIGETKDIYHQVLNSKRHTEHVATAFDAEVDIATQLAEVPRDPVHIGLLEKNLEDIDLYESALRELRYKHINPDLQRKRDHIQAILTSLR